MVSGLVNVVVEPDGGVQIAVEVKSVSIIIEKECVHKGLKQYHIQQHFLFQ